MGLLLETDEGLTADWAMVRRVCGRFDKRREWRDEGSSASRPVSAKKLEEPVSVSAGKEETRSWLETGSASSSVVKGPSGGAALEELTQMVCDLQIAQASRESGGTPHNWKSEGGQQCIWCDAVKHNRRDCADFAEAIRCNVVYLWNGKVHDSDTRRAVEPNFGHEGMRRLVEEAAACSVDVVHYSASAGIRLGGSEERKMKEPEFWPSVLESLSGV